MTEQRVKIYTNERVILNSTNERLLIDSQVYVLTATTYLTSTTLTLDNALPVNIWCWGGGGNGRTSSNSDGGGGGGGGAWALLSGATYSNGAELTIN